MIARVYWPGCTSGREAKHPSLPFTAAKVVHVTVRVHGSRPRTRTTAIATARTSRGRSKDEQRCGESRARRVSDKTVERSNNFVAPVRADMTDDTPTGVVAFS